MSATKHTRATTALAKAMGRKPLDLSTLPVPDKKRRRASWFSPVQRFWVRNPEGGVVRWLQVNRYDHGGDETSFVLRLAADDPRPRGIEIAKAKGRGAAPESRAFYCASFGRFPLGVWTEIVFAEPVTIAGLLPEHAVNREEAA